MMNNTVVESKTCAHCQSHFEITQGDMDFYDKISPKFSSPGEGGVEGGFVAKISTPTLCPDCRQRRRLSFRNERKLYRRQCDASQKSIISIYSSDKPYKVYDQTIWWSDSRDPMDYGFEFDFTKSFTENFRELMMSVPRPGLNIDLGVKSINSEYTNEGGGNKSCYLVFKTGYAENCLYSTSVSISQDCIDCTNVEGSKECYESIQCQNCYQCFYCLNCQDCSFCFGSSNLINKQYVYKNIELDKESYFNALEKDSSILRNNLKKDIIIGCDNCTGDRLYNCKNCHSCYDLSGAQDCKFCYSFIPSASDCYDVHVFGDDLTRAMEVEVAGTRSDMILGCIHINSSSNIYYSHFITNSSYLFGCIGLRNKQYCIFNKQYSKEEYEIQVAKISQHMMITGEWGEFFHPSLSPFGYNETVAQEYFPAERRVKEDKSIDLVDYSSPGLHLSPLGYSRSEYEAPTPQVDKVIKGQDLPDTIQEVNDDILKVAIVCEVSGKPFRIIPQELVFYQKHNIPLPRKHPDVRHLERMGLRK